MGPGAADSVPVPAQMIVEVRGGAVQATVNGKTTGYVAGDFFVLEKGDTVRLENKNDVAVMRAIYVTTPANKNEVR
jgi:quercetin dioxygenase-like cupin family protein